MPQNPYDVLAALKKTSSISGPPPDPSLFDGSTDYVPGTTFATDQLLGISPKSTLGQIERIPNQIVNSIPDLAGAAYGGLKNAYNSLTRDPSTPQVQAPVDTSTPTPPPAPSIFAKTPYQPGSGTGNDFNLPKQAPVNTSYEGPSGPVNDPLKGGHMDFGGPAMQPGDISAINLHQTQQDPNIALEGLQQARKSEFEDHATQLLKTGNPADLQAASAWKGQAERYEGDLANPNTPLNKMRGIDSATTAAQQQGFGIPAGQQLSPTQEQGAFARMLDTNKVNAQVNAETIRAQGNIDVTNLQNKAAADRNAQLVEWSKLHPFESATFGKNDTSVKPMAPNQMAPQGKAAVDNQNNLKAAIDRQRNLRGQFGSAYALMSGKSLADAQAAADADVAHYTSLVSPGQQAAPTVTGVQPGGGVGAASGVPPELQNLQPGQKATDPTTGETWANRNGQIQRIQ